MKICPKCGGRFDDELSFCLEDGSSLIAEPVLKNSEAVTENFEFPVHSKPTILNDDQILTNPVSSGATDLEIKPQAAKSGIVTGMLLGIGLVVLGGAIGGAAWYFNGKQAPEPTSVAANTSNPANSVLNRDQVSAAVSNAQIPDAGNSKNSNATSAPLEKAPSTSKPETSPEKEKPVEKAPSPEVKPTAKATPTPAPTRDPPSGPISGGVLNGKAIRLPQPAYPSAAKAVGAKGPVNVQILVDERGNVTRARATSGHPLLKGSAERAARRAKFSPTQINGAAVKITGIIVYNFN